MNRFSLALRCFFSLLFSGHLPDPLIADLGLTRRPVTPPKPATPPPPPAPAVRVVDGALQILGILQRDARLIDFLMEDISPYSDDQVGAAVRELHKQSRETLKRYIHPLPVIDGVEGTYVKAPAGDPNLVKFIGNVPAARPGGGTLRHKGWRAGKPELPAINPKQDVGVLAPAEIEVE